MKELGAEHQKLVPMPKSFTVYEPTFWNYFNAKPIHSKHKIRNFTYFLLRISFDLCHTNCNEENGQTYFFWTAVSGCFHHHEGNFYGFRKWRKQDIFDDSDSDFSMMGWVVKKLLRLMMNHVQFFPSTRKEKFTLNCSVMPT